MALKINYESPARYCCGSVSVFALKAPVWGSRNHPAVTFPAKLSAQTEHHAASLLPRRITNNPPCFPPHRETFSFVTAQLQHHHALGVGRLLCFGFFPRGIKILQGIECGAGTKRARCLETRQLLTDHNAPSPCRRSFPAFSPLPFLVLLE